MTPERETCDACGRPLDASVRYAPIVVSSPRRRSIVGVRDAHRICSFDVGFLARRDVRAWVYADETFTQVLRLVLEAHELPVERAHIFRLVNRLGGGVIPPYVRVADVFGSPKLTLEYVR